MLDPIIIERLELILDHISVIDERMKRVHDADIPHSPIAQLNGFAYFTIAAF